MADSHEGSELRVWLGIAWPSALGIFFRLVNPLVDLVFIGRLGTSELAAASVGQVWINVTSMFLFMSLGGALNTLCSQAYGAKNFDLVGVWLQVAVCVAGLAIVPIGVCWVFTEDVLRGVGYDAHQAHLAGVYTRLTLIGVVPNTVFFLTNNYLQSQGVVMPMVFVGAACMGLNVLFNVLFIHGTAALGGTWPGWGFQGSPVATAVTRWVALALLLAWVSARGLHKKTWPGFTRRAFRRHRWHEFVCKQALPRTVGVCLEDWQLELMAVLAAHLGKVDIATHNALLSSFFVLTSAMYGFNKASTVRIGNHLGAGFVAAARHVVKLSTVFNFGVGSVIATLFILGRHEVGKAFSGDREVWALASKVAILLGVCYFLVGAFYTAMAVLSGQSRPGIVAVAFVVGAWVVTVPLAFVLKKAIEPHLLGIWAAMCIGYVVTTAIAVVAVWRSDWEALAEEAQARSEKQGALLSPVAEAPAASGYGAINSVEEG